METDRRKRVGIFMAFGTQGDVFPIAALAFAFAREKKDYRVAFITHSAHQNLKVHLGEANVSFSSINSPPTLAMSEESASEEFKNRKTAISIEQREACLSAVERTFGDGPCMDGDFILFNYFALEGWSLAEAYHVRCVVAAPYVVPYSSPMSFSRQFSTLYPALYNCLLNAPAGKVCWKDVMHWMWPLFTEDWGSWRHKNLNLSSCPLTDPITGLPALHDWPDSPLLLYGFSANIVERPEYWPKNAHVCGFWFLPLEWQFSCARCRDSSSFSFEPDASDIKLCRTHSKLQDFLECSNSEKPVFIGLSSIGSMGFLKDPFAFLRIIELLTAITNLRFILFTAQYEPLNEAIRVLSADPTRSSEISSCLFQDRLLCFSGMVPYQWIFRRCAAAIHHGGSGTTAAALYAGLPQIVCPFIMDQFYWAEKMHWMGVAPPPLDRDCLAPPSSCAADLQLSAATVSRSIRFALSPETRSQALKFAQMLSSEDGVGEALNILAKHVSLS